MQVIDRSLLYPYTLHITHTRMHALGGPTALLASHGTSVSVTHTVRPVVVLHAVHPSVEESRSCLDPTKGTAYLSTLHYIGVSSASHLLAAVLY